MTALLFSLTKGQKCTLDVLPQDAAGDPGSLPGPVAWNLVDTALGTITQSADKLECVFVPAVGKEGVAHVIGSVPSDPAIPPVEADITVTLPLAVRLALTGRVS